MLTPPPLPPDAAGADQGCPSEPTPQEAAVRTAVVSLSRLSHAERAVWRELLAYHPESAPFVDEDWVAAWSHAFGPREPLLVCDWEGSRLVGLGVVQSRSEAWAGRRTAVIQSLTDVESPRFEFLSSCRRLDVQERLWRALCGAGRWDVIRLEYLPEDSPTLRAGIKVADELGWQRVLEASYESPWRSLPRPPAAWDAGLARKFKANLRNRERRLSALGEVSFEVVTGSGAWDRALQIFYELEASGWKRERGTAIAQRASAKAFYDRMVNRTAGQIWLPILRVGDRPAAAQVVRVAGRTMLMLKTAYHPDFSPYAPGQLLTARLIQHGIEHGMDALDFLGEHMTWKGDWAPQLRPHHHLLLFSPSLVGRYAYWMRFGLRDRAKKVPGLRRMVRWLRARATSLARR